MDLWILSKQWWFKDSIYHGFWTATWQQLFVLYDADIYFIWFSRRFCSFLGSEVLSWGGVLRWRRRRVSQTCCLPGRKSTMVHAGHFGFEGVAWCGLGCGVTVLNSSRRFRQGHAGVRWRKLNQFRNFACLQSMNWRLPRKFKWIKIHCCFCFCIAQSQTNIHKHFSSQLQECGATGFLHYERCCHESHLPLPRQMRFGASTDDGWLCLAPRLLCSQGLQRHLLGNLNLWKK